nr:immunoglobulin light chain junction region [Macaca mulatta]MOW39292.1 immunoglobulin light chain junction region [Macaca mulatta]MOW39464.1 immunoglobulin light chain junction region [Macaca mulatta]MOW39699.1 immunoglobulin light chain junction region [Macaca mulatta]MOW39761.1 immunoglobulin light chain junction region [Macaca mulatta]
CQHYYDIPYSF